jgi:TorA maturation chaperone TorD
MMIQDKEAMLKENLLGESLLFGLLGRVLYNQPDQDWLKSLIAEDVFAEVPYSAEQAETKRGQDLVQNWVLDNKEFSEGSYKDLKADYTRLFVGVGKVLAPPWESVYFSEDRMIFQKETLEVRNWYQRFGLELENLHKEPDDHIGLEMSFVAYLAELGIKLLDEQDEEKYQFLNDAKRQFLSEHLLQWGPAWCALVKEHAKTDFYRGLGYLTMGALLTIAEKYDLQVPKEVVK